METQKQHHWPEKMMREEKLQALQISKDDFHFYTSTFIQDRGRYLIKEAGQRWREAKTKNGKSAPLTDGIVSYHLLGKYEIATVAPKITRHCCVIVQYIEEFRHLYGKIASYLRTPLVFFDKETRRLHYYAHLEFPISSGKLFSIMSWQLDQIGITPPLSYNIFPHYPVFLRLPLGRDSFVVDSRTLNPVCKGTEVKETIGFIRSHLTRCTFRELFPNLPERDGGPTYRQRSQR